MSVRSYLLPIPLQTEFQGTAKYSLSIIEFVGEGYTSEVFRGQLTNDLGNNVDVAVKAMKPIGAEVGNQKFREEGAILNLLGQEEDKVNKDQADNWKVGPKYYGLGEYGGIVYLVMEFVRGATVTDLLDSGQLFSEQEVVRIGHQFFRTMDLLHTRLKRSFIDLKIENLWWVPQEKGIGSLKITDFGTLADISEKSTALSDPRRDLLLGGIICLRLLTGYGLTYSIDGLRESANPIIRQHEMSWGLRNLFRKILHKNPQVRFQTADEIKRQFRVLEGLWAMPPEKLLEIASKNLERAREGNQADGHEVRERASKALEVLGILEKNPGSANPKTIEQLTAEAQAIWNLKDFMGIGLRLFEGASYSEARKQFEEGQHWAEDPAQLRRWKYLASIPEEIDTALFRNHRDAAVEALERLNEGNFKAAAERFSKLKTQIPSKGLDALVAEVEMTFHLAFAEQAAREENYSDAGRSYRAAMNALERLPDRDFVRAEELGDLLQSAEEMDRLAETIGKARDAFTEGRKMIMNGDIQGGAKKITQVFSVQFEYPDLEKDLPMAYWAALDQGDSKSAYSIAQIGLRFPKSAVSLIPEIQAIQALAEVQELIKQRHYVRIEERLNRLLGLYADDQRLLRIVDSSLRDLEETTSRTGEIEGWQALAKVLVNLPGDHAEWIDRVRQHLSGIKSTEQERNQLMVDSLIQRTAYLLNLEQAGATKELGKDLSAALFQQEIADRRASLKEARQWASDALRIAGPHNYRVGEIDNLITRTVRALEVVEKRKQISDAARTERQKGLEQAELQLGEAMAELDRMSQESDWADPHRVEQSNRLHRKIQQHAMNILQQRSFIENELDGETATRLLVKANQAIDLQGSAGWMSLSEKARQRADQINRELNEVKRSFGGGDLSAAAEEIDRLARSHAYSVEVVELKSQISTAQRFVAWQEEIEDILNANEVRLEVLAGIYEYSHLVPGIPLVYWANSPARKYLHFAHGDLTHSLRDMVNSKKLDTDKGLYDVKAWIIATKTRQLLEKQRLPGKVNKVGTS